MLNKVARAVLCESSVLSPMTPALCPADAGMQIIPLEPQFAKPRAAGSGGPALRRRRAPPATPGVPDASCPQLRSSYGLREGRGPGRVWKAAGAGPRAALARRRSSARRRAGRASLCSFCRGWGRWSPGPRARSSPQSRQKHPRVVGRAGFGF